MSKQCVDMKTGAREFLHGRLGAFRRRLRLVLAVQGTAWLIATVLCLILAGGVLDFGITRGEARSEDTRPTLESDGKAVLLRSFLLLAGLGGAVVVGYRVLWRPLRAPTDDLSLALRIEEKFPALNDSFASMVEFLAQEAGAEEIEPGYGQPGRVSSVFRCEAIRRAVQEVEHCPFTQAIDRRGWWFAGLCGGVTLVLAALLLFWNPALCGTALLRLADPYGGHPWPKQTTLELAPFPAQVGRNQLFEVKAVVRGVVPGEAVVAFRLQDQNGVSSHATLREQVCQVTPDRHTPQTGTVRARLEPDLVQADFTFCVKANDAISGWHSVQVVPPPTLVPLKGRDSPQVFLRYPRYTGLPERALPPGVGDVETVAGTLVLLRAAADRPLRRAWVSFQPQPYQGEVAAFLAPLGAADATGAASLLLAGRMIWGEASAILSPDGRTFTVQFLTCASGTYALHFEDAASGVCGSRLFEIQVVSDPSPVVRLERPSSARDILYLLPEAEFAVRAFVQDPVPRASVPVQGIRSVYLDYRIVVNAPRGPAMSTAHRLMLYDGPRVTAASTAAMVTLGVGPSGSVAWLAPPGHGAVGSRLGPTALHIDQRLELRQLYERSCHEQTPCPGSALTPNLTTAGREAEVRGRGPIAGDTIFLQVLADDYDDVAVDKSPGRSRIIEVRVVTRTDLEEILGQEQTRLQQELVRMRDLQRAAIRKVQKAQDHFTGREQRALDEINLLIEEAKQLQDRLRERLGTSHDGLQAGAARILQAHQANRLPRSLAQERVEEAAAELARLARNEVQQIPLQLADIRRQNHAMPGTRAAPSALRDISMWQEIVEKSLNDLAILLEPWSTLAEVRGESKLLLKEQRELREATRVVQTETLGAARQELSREMLGTLERLAEDQMRLHNRVSQFLDKIQRLGNDRSERHSDAAEQLQAAYTKGTEGNGVAEVMRQAAQHIKDNQLGEAAARQQQSIQALETVAKALRDQPQRALERLRRNLGKLEDRLARLAEDQAKLQKSIREANKMPEREKQGAFLRKLAEEQERLGREQAAIVEELQRLSRIRSQHVREALGEAGGQMERACGRLKRGEDPEHRADLHSSLEEARQEVRQLRQELEEELTRGQKIRLIDEIKGLRERQAGLVEELGRVHSRLRESAALERMVLVSLGDLARHQKELGRDTRNLAVDLLAELELVAAALRRSADQMEQTGEHLQVSRRRFLDNEPLTGQADPADKAGLLQREILKELDSLLESLKLPPRTGGSTVSSGSPGNGPTRQRRHRPAASKPMEDGARPASALAKPTGKGSKAAKPLPFPGGIDKQSNEFHLLSNHYKEIWGHLPEALRTELDSYGREAFMAKYRDLIERYYATIAEKSLRQGD